MKTLLTALTLTLAFFAPAQDSLSAPQHLCTNIMEMLINIDSTKYYTYTALFISKEDVPSLIDQMTLSEEQKDNMKKRSSGNMQEEYCQREFSALLSNGKSMNVTWKNIEFKDFLYQIQMRKGIKELRGEIYFTDGSAEYQVGLQAVFHQEKFQLLELGDLFEPGDKSFYQSDELTEEEVQVMELETMEVVQATPTKSQVIRALTNLYLALEAGDFELALSFLIAPSGFTKEEIKKELENLLERNEITLEGIQRLQEEATLESIEEHHGERGLLKTERAGLNSEECSALYIEGSIIECMFHWDGTKVRFFRIDNIRANEGDYLELTREK